MGKRVKPKSSDTFESEVQRQFGPLAEEWGMTGPVDASIIIPSLEYQRDRLTYDWMFDTEDGAVSVDVRLVVTEGLLSADVETIVVGHGMGSPQSVHTSARTWHSLELSIASHVRWLGRLHPSLSGPDAQDFLLRAGARTTHPDLE
jgi:hypothetical protein